MKKNEIINAVLALILVFGIGLTIGYSLGFFKSAQASFPAFKEIEDINPNIATIRFLKLENNVLKGEIVGQKTRLAYSTEHVIDLNPGDAFEIPIYEVRLGQYYSARDLPEGIQYIASSSGKYYYSILSSKAFGITPKNRLHFKTEAEAEKMGFLPSK